MAEVEGLLLSVLDDLARHGPTQADLDRRLDDLHLWAGSPASIPGRLDAAVRDLLLGGEPELLVDLEAEQAAVKPGDVSQALERAIGSMLLATPSTGFVPNRGLRPYPGPLPDVFPSHLFSEAVAKKRPWDPSPPTRGLRIGSDGVALDDPAGRRLTTILWSDCVAVVRGTAGRRIMGRDGFSLDVEAHAWERGADAIRLVDQFGPVDCVVGVAP